MTISQTFLNNFTLFSSKNNLITERNAIVIAVSGGLDSIVLLDLFAKLRKKWNLRLAVAHVNFQLRSNESDDDENFVKNLAKTYKIPFYSTQVDSKTEATSAKLNIQEFAREFRYNFFNNLKNSLKFDCIATAHNANDNAETLLLNLFRGSGLDGLTGISSFRKDLCVIRPLLFATRDKILSYAKENDLQWREDSSNSNQHYRRNFIRKSLIPLIQKKINPSIVETLNSEVNILNNVTDFVNKEFRKQFPKIAKQIYGNWKIQIETLKKQNQLLKELAVREILKNLAIEPTYHHIESILGLIQNQSGKKIELNKNWIAVRNNAEIVFRPFSAQLQFSHFLEKEGRITTKEFVFSIQKSVLPKKLQQHNPLIEYVDATKIEFPLTVRVWNSGDTFIPLGMKKEKKLSNFFIDNKIPVLQKNKIPVIESQTHICWIAGLRIDDRCKITENTKSVYKLTIKYLNEEKKYNS